jgi:hypothetical protein
VSVTSAIVRASAHPRRATRTPGRGAGRAPYGVLGVAG